MSLGNNSIHQRGEIPEITKLPNDRIRVVRRFQKFTREDIDNVNLGSLMGDFGDLDTTGEQVTNQGYTNCRLISVEVDNRFNALGNADNAVLVKTYETITDTFVQIEEDEIDSELNGLRRVTRESIATVDTDYDGDVGVTTIQHRVNDEAQITLYLASFDIEDTEAYRKVTEVYIQAGELARDERPIGEGVLQTTIETLVEEPTIADGNYVISKDITNFDGIRTFSTSFISKKDGTTLTESDGGEKLAISYQQLVPFIFPGVIDLKNIRGHVFPATRAPVESTVKADVQVFYQRDNEIVEGDFTKTVDSVQSLGLWNPDEWATKEATIDSYWDSSNQRVEPAYFNVDSLRGYRTGNKFTISGDLNTAFSTNKFNYEDIDDVQKNINVLKLEETVDKREGKSIFRGSFKYIVDFTKSVNSGGGGVVVIRSDYLNAIGFFTYEMSWNGTQWELIIKSHKITDQQPTDVASNGDFVYSVKESSSGYQDAYTNKSSIIDTDAVVFTSTNGANEPNDANFPSSLSISDLENKELIAGSSIANAVVNSNSVDGRASWIEGRRCPLNASASIEIQGGPPDPLGKRYTLDVEIKKAFTDDDGVDVYQKKIVSAVCTPV